MKAGAVIYLDHNAIPPMRPEAIAAVRAALDVFGNPSSVHAAGRAARDVLDRARAQVARALGAEPGEVVPAGTPVITLIDLSRVYLRGFIPEGQIGRVRVGQQAHVFLDSAPNKPIEAVVMRIDPQATFTPENTYFREDRVKQVVGVKVLLRGAEGFAKPGMPADGEILVDGTAWPARRGRR